jgi:tetratricopeptide (TPR) repeat protein
MFFSRFFKKDADSLIQKGDKLLASHDFSHAVHAFEDALAFMQNENPDSDKVARAKQGLREALNSLALLNLQEAEHQIQLGNMDKAEEHIELALHQTEDTSMQEKALKLRAQAAQAPTPAPIEKTSAGHSCSGCGSHNHEHTPPDSDDPDMHFAGDRFELLTAALPGDLPKRYTSLGDEFAKAYILSDENQNDQAFEVLRSVPGAENNDIILYEMGVIRHRQNNLRECEALFKKSLAVNQTNPLTNLGYFHLLADSGRLPEAASLLEAMIAMDVLKLQAQLFLGDVKAAMGQENDALEIYSELLKTSIAKEAAKRVVPLLQRSGREQEAAFVAKQHLKGCC